MPWCHMKNNNGGIPLLNEILTVETGNTFLTLYSLEIGMSQLTQQHMLHTCAHNL